MCENMVSKFYVVKSLISQEKYDEAYDYLEELYENNLMEEYVTLVEALEDEDYYFINPSRLSFALNIHPLFKNKRKDLEVDGLSVHPNVNHIDWEDFYEIPKENLENKTSTRRIVGYKRIGPNYSKEEQEEIHRQHIEVLKIEWLCNNNKLQEAIELDKNYSKQFNDKFLNDIYGILEIESKNYREGVKLLNKYWRKEKTRVLIAVFLTPRIRKKMDLTKPTDNMINFYRARAYYNLKEYKKTLRIIDFYIEETPKKDLVIKSHYLKALTLEKLNRNNEAVLHLNNVLDMINFNLNQTTELGDEILNKSASLKEDLIEKYEIKEEDLEELNKIEKRDMSSYYITALIITLIICFFISKTIFTILLIICFVLAYIFIIRDYIEILRV